MQAGHETELLEVVRSYLTSLDASELAVPELSEPERVFAMALRDLGYELESEVTSLTVTDLARDEAAVLAKRTILATGRDVGEAQEQELTVHVVDREGWKVRDVVADGESALASLHRVTVEPAEAEGIRISAWARSEPSGDIVIAICLRNDTASRWRLKCAGATWRKGPLRFISQLSRRALGRGGRVDYDPGAEHGVMLMVPAKVERLWLKATPRRGLRSLLFALSWEPARPATSRASAGRLRSAIPIAAGAVPLAAVAAFVGVTKSLPAAILIASLLVVVPLVGSHCCVVRLERKLARLRAELARSPVA